MKALFKEATLLASLGHLPDKPEDAPKYVPISIPGSTHHLTRISSQCTSQQSLTDITPPSLKFIHLFSAGIDHFAHHPIFTDSDIPITTSSGIHGPPISEWILSSCLASSKNFITTYENQKKHHWGSQTHRDMYSSQTDWVGKRVGIAGYGSIGRQVARVFTAMGSEVVAYTASPRTTKEERMDKGYIVPGTGDPEGKWPVAWFSGTSKEALYTFLRAKLDCLIICLPLTDATRGLLGQEEFQVLKAGNGGKGCFLVNISRGGIIRQGDLVQCLNDGTLEGAALDVTTPEPLPEDDELWDAKNVIISPHVSALGKEYMGRAYDVLMLNLGRLEKGDPLVNEVRRKRGY